MFSKACLLAVTLASHRLTKAEEPEADAACVKGSFVLEFDECTYENVREEFQNLFADAADSCDHSSDEDLSLLLTGSVSATEAEAKAAVRAICIATWDGHKKVAFEDIAREYGQFEQNYYNGGTYWNEEVETLNENEDGSRSNHLKHDARYVKQFYESEGETNMVEYPTHLTNFDPDTCSLPAAYCCWPKDRQANDNNGNCNTPYDTKCYDKNPADNTDLCYIDMERSPLSNAFGTSGSVVFPWDNSDGEGAIHCHGFAWSNDEYDFTSRYKGNNLFYVSMYDHMHQRGYVRNIQGSPMCGCAEQMPTVSRSDCTQIDVEESYKISYNGITKTFTGSLEEIQIEYNACQGKYNEDNDLWYYFLSLQDEGKVTADEKHALNKYIVGDNNCRMASGYHMLTKGYIRGYQEEESEWVQVLGKGDMAFDTIGPLAFRELFEAADLKIIHRVCSNCVDSHKHIYYKRLTAVPEELNLSYYLRNKWMSTYNQFNVDFELYSTFEDAVSGQNRWQYCNFSSNTGFPYECGPTGRVTNQHSRFHWSNGQPHVAFYMRKSIDMQGRSDNGMRVVDGVDIGNVMVPGSAFFMNDKYYIGASGKDIWYTNDEAFFVSQEVTGDVSIQAHVEGITWTHDWAKGGLMMRETKTGPSRAVACMVSPRHGPIIHTRYETGEHMVNGPYVYNSKITDVWLKLTKKADEYSCYKSTDGTNWSKISTVTVNMGETVHYGMVHTSHNDWVKGEIVMSDYAVDFMVEEFEEVYANLNEDIKDNNTDTYFEKLVESVTANEQQYIALP